MEASKELHSESKTLEAVEEAEAEAEIKSLVKGEAEEVEAEAEIKSLAKGEVEDTPKFPTQQEPLTTSWVELAKKEDPLRLM
jgi:hypothetical protein